MKRVCIYHSADKDGHASGAIIANHFGLDNITLIGWNYGQDIPWNDIDGADEVYLVDLSFRPWKKMVELDRRCKTLIWIDHHKSAITDYMVWRESGEDSTTFVAKFDDVHAGCELVWEYFYGDETTPDAIHLIGRYDVWDWENVAGSLEFQYGLRAYETRPENQELWGKLLAHSCPMVKEIISQGETIIAYKKIQDRIHIHSAGFEMEWEGYKFIAINEMFNNSQLFDSMFDPEVHDAMLTFGYRKGKWFLGFYSPKKLLEAKGIDLGALAKRIGKKYGGSGGGHPGAAGCQLPCLPFKLPGVVS